VFWRLENIQQRFGKQFTENVKFIGVAAKSVLSVDRAKNITTDAKIIIVFDFYVSNIVREDEIEKFEFETTTRRTVDNYKHSRQNLWLNRLKIA
jgi:hypothetical protein